MKPELKFNGRKIWIDLKGNRWAMPSNYRELFREYRKKGCNLHDNDIDRLIATTHGEPLSNAPQT